MSQLLKINNYKSDDVHYIIFRLTKYTIITCPKCKSHPYYLSSKNIFYCSLCNGLGAFAIRKERINDGLNKISKELFYYYKHIVIYNMDLLERLKLIMNRNRVRNILELYNKKYKIRY